MPSDNVPAATTVAMDAEGHLTLSRHVAEARDLAERTLSPEEQLVVCGHIAQFKTNKWIAAYLRRCGNAKAQPATVQHYRTAAKWQPLVDRLREEYRARILEVPVANQRVRLEALQEQYEMLTDQHPEGNRAAAAVRSELRDVLKQAQDEVVDRKGSSLTFVTQVMALSDEELERKRQQVVAQIAKLGGPKNGQSGHALETTVVRPADEQAAHAAGGQGDERPAGGS